MQKRKRAAKTPKSRSSEARNKALRARVQELEKALLALRRGSIDAPSIGASSHPYRVLVETINEGAATLDAKGTVLFANARFAEFLNLPLKKFIGAPLQNHVPASAREKLWELIQLSLQEDTKDEISLGTPEGRASPDSILFQRRERIPSANDLRGGDGTDRARTSE